VYRGLIAVVALLACAPAAAGLSLVLIGLATTLELGRMLADLTEESHPVRDAVTELLGAG
jgi:hypothetical protein